MKWQSRFAIFGVVWCLGWMLWSVSGLLAERSTEIVADVDGGDDQHKYQ